MSGSTITTHKHLESNKVLYYFLQPFMYLMKLGGIFPGPITPDDLPLTGQYLWYNINTIWYLLSLISSVAGILLLVIPIYFKTLTSISTHNLSHDFLRIICNATYGQSIIYAINFYTASATTLRQIRRLDGLSTRFVFRGHKAVMSWMVFWILASAADSFIQIHVAGSVWFSAQSVDYGATIIKNCFGFLSHDGWASVITWMIKPILLRNLIAGMSGDVVLSTVIFSISTSFDRGAKELGKALDLSTRHEDSTRWNMITQCVQDHVKLCRVTAELNSAVAPTIITMFFSALVYILLCVDSFGLNYTTLEYTGSYFETVTPALSYFFMLMMVTYNYTRIYVKAGQIESLLQKGIETETDSVRKSLFVTHLIRVKSLPAAITLAGVVVVNRQFLLIVLGFFASYAMLFWNLSFEENVLGKRALKALTSTMDADIRNLSHFIELNLGHK